MRYLVTLAFLLFCAAPAVARIGDNTRACEVRYGKPVRISDEGDLATYKRGRLSVVVHFTGGVADMVSFRKLPRAGSPETHEPAKPFEAEEVQSLLTDNSGGRAWIEAASGGERTRIWSVEDGALFARWDLATDSLTIYTQAFAGAD